MSRWWLWIILYSEVGLLIVFYISPNLTDFVFSFHAFAEVPRHSRWRWPGSLNLFPMHAQKCRYSRWPRSAGLTLSHACAEMPHLNRAVTSWFSFLFTHAQKCRPSRWRWPARLWWRMRVHSMSRGEPFWRMAMALSWSKGKLNKFLNKIL